MKKKKEKDRFNGEGGEVKMFKIPRSGVVSYG